jgi:hypothetical protein
MNALHRTRRLLLTLAADLRDSAALLDADAERLLERAPVEARRLRADLEHAAARLDTDAVRVRNRASAEGRRLNADLEFAAARLDADAVHVTRAGHSIAAVALPWLDAAAARIDNLHPGLLRPKRAARLARTLSTVVAMLTIVSAAALATLAGSHDRIPLDRLASEQAPARLQALAQEDPAGGAANGGTGAPSNGSVAATGATGPAVPANPVAPAAPQTIPANRGALPVGKGMWIWQPERTEGNNAEAIVARAKATGLTHLYVRTGTLKGGFVAAEFLNRLLPMAHAANIRVYGWDFPYLNDIDSDVARAVTAISYTTPDGHRIDGFSADIELRSMGVNINNITAFVYGEKLRHAVGRAYPLIATVPRPSGALVNYPFAEIAAHFDAIAPMVYWMGNDPAATVADTIARLSMYDRPILPVGQAYDGAGEGGPAGVPARPQLLAFMTSAEKAGAASVSWWSWQHADQQAWDAVKDAPEFPLPVGPAAEQPGPARAYQTLLWSLGFNAPKTGVWDAATAGAVADYQRAARLPVTGAIDEQTRLTLLTPFPPPIRPE